MYTAMVLSALCNMNLSCTACDRKQLFSAAAEQGGGAGVS